MQEVITLTRFYGRQPSQLAPHLLATPVVACEDSPETPHMLMIAKCVDVVSVLYDTRWAVVGAVYFAQFVKHHSSSNSTDFSPCTSTEGIELLTAMFDMACIYRPGPATSQCRTCI